MSKIRLELDGRPGSFFEAEVKGSELHVAFGPRDRIVPPKARSFPSEAAARAELDRLVGLHKAKQYYEKLEAPPKPELSPKELIEKARDRAEWLGVQLERAKQPATWQLVTDDALLEACEATPDDPAPWHVYADRLAAGDDPRGELALGFLRGLAWEANKALVECLGDVVPLEVRHGFVRSAGVRGDPDRLARFLMTPFAASLRTLRVGLGELGDWTAALAAIAASPAGLRLRELVFDASDQLVRDTAGYQATVRDDAPDQDAYDDYGDYSQAYDEHVRRIDDDLRARLAAVSPVRFSDEAPWHRFTRLERLVIDGPLRGDLGVLELPELRELVIRSDRLARVAELANARCPKLALLELWFGDQVWSGDDGALDPSPLFASGVFPSLQTLRVFDADDVTLARVRSSKIAKRVALVTTPPEGALAARYALPQSQDRLPFDLPRGGEPPKPKKATRGSLRARRR